MKVLEYEDLDEYINVTRETNNKINQIRNDIWTMSIPIQYINKKNKIEIIDEGVQTIIKTILLQDIVDFDSLMVIMSPYYSQDKLLNIIKQFSKVNSKDFIFHLEREFIKIIENDKIKKIKKYYISLTPFTLKYIFNGVKYSFEQKEILKLTNPNPIIMNNIKIADRVVASTLKRLNLLWNSVSDSSKKKYIKKSYIKFYEIPRFLKLPLEEKEKYLAELNFEQNKMKPYLGSRYTNDMYRILINEILVYGNEIMDDIINKREMDEKHSSESMFDYKYFSSYKEQFYREKEESEGEEEYRYKRYCLLYDLITLDKKYDYLELIKNSVRGLVEQNTGNKLCIDEDENKLAISNNFLKYQHIKMMETIEYFCNYVLKVNKISPFIKKENKLVNVVERSFKKEFELLNIVEEMYILTGCNIGLHNIKFSLDKKSGHDGKDLLYNYNKKENKKIVLEQKLTDDEIKQLNRITEDIMEIKNKLEALKSKYNTNRKENKFTDKKSDYQNQVVEDENPIVTIDYLRDINVYIENITLGKRNDKQIIVVNVAAFDTSKVSMNQREIRKRVLVACDWINKLIPLDETLFKINYTLYYPEAFKDCNYQKIYNTIVKKAVGMRVPDNFKTVCLYRYKGIKETITCMIDEIKTLVDCDTHTNENKS